MILIRIFYFRLSMMSSRTFYISFLMMFLIVCLSGQCPSKWTALNRDCCSPTFGLKSTNVTFIVQGFEYPTILTVWNDPHDYSLAVDTDWTTLNIYWGQLKGNRSKPYVPFGPIDIVRIFYQEGKGLDGLQFHNSSAFSPIFGKTSPTFIDLSDNGRFFSGWGVITHQSELLQSLAACFRIQS